MSNYPDDFRGTNMDSRDTAESILADKAIKWMDNVRGSIFLMLVDGCRSYDINIGRVEAKEALDLIDEALSDLFYRERIRFQSLTGDTSRPFRPLPGHIVTNPATLIETGRLDGEAI